MAAVGTDVRVSKRVLWVGSDAYPLQNIARAQVGTIPPERGKPVKDFIKAIAGWIGLCLVLSIALAVLGVSNNGPYVLVIAVVLIVISVVRLVRALEEERGKLPYYLLLLQTSGDPRTVLASTDRDQIYELVRVIMDAIDNPEVTYHKLINNYFGDIVRQYGSDNVGKIMA